MFPTSDNLGLVWQETVNLRDVAGVASILTGFSIDGQAQALAAYFPSPAVPPNTSVSSTPVVLRNLGTATTTHTFGMTGVDTTGQTWSRQISVPFLGPTVPTAGFRPTLVPLTMAQNTSAPAGCQWSQQLFIDETRGETNTISSLMLGAVNLTAQIPAIFGTTRLQAWGSLQGTLCWSGMTAGSSSTVQVGLSSGLGQTTQVNFAGAGGESGIDFGFARQRRAGGSLHGGIRLGQPECQLAWERRMDGRGVPD